MSKADGEIEMDEPYRASEYETVRKEMSDRLLFVYGLLPAYASVIATYLALVINRFSKDLLLIITLPIFFLTCVFAFVAHSLLCNLYNSGSYLIVYHELKSDHQYLLRSRFLKLLNIKATGVLKPTQDLPISDTGPTMAIAYFGVTLFSTLLLLSQFDWLSNSYLIVFGLILIVLAVPISLLPLPALFGTLLLFSRFDLLSLGPDWRNLIIFGLDLLAGVVLVCILFKLWHVKSTMEADLLKYKNSKKIEKEDTDFIFKELDNRHHILD